MASTVQRSTFESNHHDMIHDTQPDYYGKRLATCSSDRTIKIFDLATKTVEAEWQGHDGPVWQLAWAHPKFGNVIASCGFDRKVVVWMETEKGKWQNMYEYSKHTSSVNSVAWAPHEEGLVLAVGSSDSNISILTHNDDQTWKDEMITGCHPMGCNAVSWAPFLKPGALFGTAEGSGGLQFVSGGCDNRVKIWTKVEGEWKEDKCLDLHTDWVRDVAWAPNIGLPVSTIASCSQDRQVVIWTNDGVSGEWSRKELPKFSTPVWRVSWSVTGNILAVCSGDNRVTLWKEIADGEWRLVSSLTEGGVDPASK